MRFNRALSRLLCSALMVGGLAVLPASAAMANLVVNGGFETGDFTGWTQINNTGFNGVECPGSGLSGGQCDAFFGPVGSLGGIQQSFATTAGAQYFVSFVFRGDGGTPGNFVVDFGGINLVNQVNSSNTGIQTFGFNALATGASTLLRFQFRDDPGFMLLDNVQVAAATVPEPTTVALLGLALAGLSLSRRRRAR